MGKSRKNASLWKKIEAKAEEIFSAGDQIKKLSDERWQVSSQLVAGRSYVVSFGMKGSSCECVDSGIIIRSPVVDCNAGISSRVIFRMRRCARHKLEYLDPGTFWTSRDKTWRTTGGMCRALHVSTFDNLAR